jgi:hypothetical protein
MIKKLTLLIAIIFSTVAYAQTSNYWQQSIKYKMNIDMNVENYRYTGKTKITYYNNSPNTLNKVYFHLYFNAFQPGSEMDVRQQTLPDPDRRIGKRISKLDSTEIGYQKILSIKQGRIPLNFKIEGTLMEVKLNKSILPNSKTTFYIENEAQVPVQIRRSGRNNSEGVKLSMTQWYPKMAEYDREGWHLDSYIAREFIGVYGTFDITINIDRNYTIGGTGILQNPQEIGHGYESKGEKLNIAKTEKLKWHFVAKKVHDFAWGADDEYKHDILTMNSDTDMHFFYKKGDKNRTKNWKELELKMQEAFQFINKKFGKYPYKQFSFVQGGDGGMEYPMSTLILGNSNSVEGLVGLAVHESLHSWYQGVLGFNEQKHPWMDEGFTTWAENLTMNYLYGPKGKNIHKGSYRGYFAVQRSGKEEALTTKADFYNTNFAYGQASYSKGAVFLAQLGYIIGDENLNKTMLRLFDKWKFKHPTPNDVKLIAEDVSGIQLQWYFNKWITTTQTIDYAITSVKENNDKTKIILSKIGDIPMPLDITVALNNGDVKTYYIPLRMMRGSKPNETKLSRQELKAWPWVYPEYSFEIDIPKNQIKLIGIDITDRMADIDKKNNYYPFDEFIFEGN